MLRAARLLAGLAALIAAGATFAHTGTHLHAHPHPDLDLYVLLVAVVGAALGALHLRSNRSRSGQ